MPRDMRTATAGEAAKKRWRNEKTATADALPGYPRQSNKVTKRNRDRNTGSKVSDVHGNDIVGGANSHGKQGIQVQGRASNRVDRSKKAAPAQSRVQDAKVGYQNALESSVGGEEDNEDDHDEGGKVRAAHALMKRAQSNLDLRNAEYYSLKDKDHALELRVAMLEEALKESKKETDKVKKENDRLSLRDLHFQQMADCVYFELLDRTHRLGEASKTAQSIR